MKKSKWEFLSTAPAGGKEYRNKHRIDTIMIVYPDRVKLFKDVIL